MIDVEDVTVSIKLSVYAFVVVWTVHLDVLSPPLAADTLITFLQHLAYDILFRLA